MRPDLTIGITTWNSALFLRACLEGIRRTTSGLHVQVEVMDNMSLDESVALAKAAGARVEVARCTQAEALNRLLFRARAPVTLLMHADVVLLDPRWFELCRARLSGDCALVSPEDVGCGPMTRPFGRDRPESSFLCFDTARARKCMHWTTVRRLGVRWPRRRLDLYGAHVTHNLPGVLAGHGFTWFGMRVHTSPRLDAEHYSPPFIPEYWADDLGSLRYALGNFYSVEDRITHYHNWFDRALREVPLDSVETTGGGGLGTPVAWLWQGAKRFLGDYEAGRLALPDVAQDEPAPQSVPRRTPDLARRWSREGETDGIRRS